MFTSPPSNADNAPCSPAHHPAIAAIATVARSCQPAMRPIGKPGGERAESGVATERSKPLDYRVLCGTASTKAAAKYAGRSVPALAARQRADDHHFIVAVKARREVARLRAVDKKLDVPANAPVLVDDAKANARIAPVEVAND